MSLECKTCQTSYYCDLIKLGDTKGCPCKECIIKTMCDEACELFEDFYESKIGFPPSSYKGY
jgi:hypothetical protein